MKTNLLDTRINRPMNTGYNTIFELNQASIDNSINRMENYGLLNQDSIAYKRR